MIINKDDKHAQYFHGITIVDEACRPLNFVNEFDTETLLCKVGPLGKVVVAATFVIIPQPRIYDYLPEGLYPFVIPVKNPSPDQVHAFAMKLLEQRGNYKRSTFGYEDMDQGKDVEDTFNWPREAFVGLAQTVRPSDEEETKAAERVEKNRWEGGHVVYDKEFGIDGSALLPWKDKVRNLRGCTFSSLWLRVQEGKLVQWGVAVKPPVDFAIPNTTIGVKTLTKPKTVLKTVDKDIKEQLFGNTWKVISTRGQENGTIELMLTEKNED
jgi:hypothetical protein